MFLRTFQTEPAFAERKLFICEKVFAAVVDLFDKPAIADSGGQGVKWKFLTTLELNL